jgi:hypothetical protein
MGDFVRDLLDMIALELDKVEHFQDAITQDAYLQSAVLLPFCVLEAYVNRLADEVPSRQDLSPRERALLERNARLDDRIAFLHTRFSGRLADETAAGWAAFKDALDLRDRINESKPAPALTVPAVKAAIKAVIDTIDALSRDIYKRPLSAADIGSAER